MTDFCPNCGKKAEDGEKTCSVCGEEITSLSQDEKYNKNSSNKNIKEKIVTLIFLTLVISVGCGIAIRYFNAGKNIASNANSQKSELKILKRPSTRIHDRSDEDAIVKKEKSNIKEYEGSKEEFLEKEHSGDKNLVLEKKEKYMKIMANLDKEVKDLADSELNGDDETLLNYTSKIYKKYDVVLNMIYGDILSVLESGDVEKLKQDELDWIKKKDEAASFSVGSEDTVESDENWAYFDSLATSTKDRCYYLINNYMY